MKTKRELKDTIVKLKELVKKVGDQNKIIVNRNLTDKEIKQMFSVLDFDLIQVGSGETYIRLEDEILTVY